MPQPQYIDLANTTTINSLTLVTAPLTGADLLMLNRITGPTAVDFAVTMAQLLVWINANISPDGGTF